MIPQLLHSEYTGQPFERCLACEAELLVGKQTYSVQKLIVGREAVFEMALCGDCTVALCREFSAESRRAIIRFLEARFGPLPASVEDLESLMSEADAPRSGPDPLEACALCARPRGECRRYGVGGSCCGEHLVLRPRCGPVISSPWMICDDCNTAVNALISKQTRETWDRFITEHFDGPPGTAVDLPDFRPLLV